MNRNEFYNHFGVNLDLALEAHELLRGEAQKEIPGVEEKKESHEYADVTTINIFNATGAQIMGKAQGLYVTIEAPNLRANDLDCKQEVSELIAMKLREMLVKLAISPKDHVLLVGLGNWQATPDALGPKVMDEMFVTSHLLNYAPESLPKGTRPISAFTPGVLGLTGMETAEVIRGVVDRVRPKLVIAIDALAARNVNRIVSTVQLADTGINPGSGVGNQRAGISRDFLGVPVIAIGVPTVVHAAVIAFEVFDSLKQSLPSLEEVSDQTLNQVVRRILEPFGGQLTVTPKEIDELIPGIGKVIAEGISKALQPPELIELARYLH